VLLHAPDDDLPVLRHSGALGALRALQHAGLVRAVGISVKSLDCALEAAKCCDVVMLEYSLAAGAMAPAIRRCEELGCGVLVKKALGSGRLAAGGGTTAALAGAFAPAGVNAVVVGTRDPAHLAECIDATEHALGR
jgi:aryl-alcohol dehydrogenase-like predicted oxidoreductase